MVPQERPACAQLPRAPQRPSKPCKQTWALLLLGARNAAEGQPEGALDVEALSLLQNEKI